MANVRGWRALSIVLGRHSVGVTLLCVGMAAGACWTLGHLSGQDAAFNFALVCGTCAVTLDLSLLLAWGGRQPGLQSPLPVLARHVAMVASAGLLLGFLPLLLVAPLESALTGLVGQAAALRIGGATTAVALVAAMLALICLDGTTTGD